MRYNNYSSRNTKIKNKREVPVNNELKKTILAGFIGFTLGVTTTLGVSNGIKIENESKIEQAFDQQYADYARNLLSHYSHHNIDSTGRGTTYYEANKIAGMIKNSNNPEALLVAIKEELVLDPSSNERTMSSIMTYLDDSIDNGALTIDKLAESKGYSNADQYMNAIKESIYQEEEKGSIRK